MGLQYENLDEETRRFMVDEIDMDVRDGTIYISNYLNPRGCDLWPRILREAAEHGTDESLAEAIIRDRCLKDRVERKKPKGGFTIAAVPVPLIRQWAKVSSIAITHAGFAGARLRKASLLLKCIEPSRCRSLGRIPSKRSVCMLSPP